MRRWTKKLILTGMIISMSLMTACGLEETETTETATEIEDDKIVIATAPPSETEAVVQEEQRQGDAQTPSGMAVEENVQKYSVIQGCNVRKDSSGDSEWVASLQVGQVVQGTGVCENGWIQIEYDNASAYVTGSCLTATEDGEAVTGSAEVSETPAEDATDTSVNATEFFQEEDNAREVDVTDWAKYTSSKWESSDRTSCFLQIHSVAGNQVIFRLQVVDGPLADMDKEGVMVAEIPNCTGKIENGILGFSFTDSYGNLGIGKMEIVDDTHLSIATVITQPEEGAAYKAEIMTTLEEIEN